MDARDDRPRVEAHVLHDVDLAAGRPADLVDVRPEHPEGRPGAAPRGQLRPDLDLAVEELGAPPGVEAGGRVVVAHPALAAGLDDQSPALDPRVLGARGVVLLLVVGDVADLVVPPRGVGGSRHVELVREDERPARGSRRGEPPGAGVDTGGESPPQAAAGARRRTKQAAWSRGRAGTGHLLTGPPGRPGPSGGDSTSCPSGGRGSRRAAAPAEAAATRRRASPTRLAKGLTMKK